MLFLPCFTFVIMSAIYHICLFFVFLHTDELSKVETMQWVLFGEGLLDDLVQFYMFFMAPI